MKIAVLGDIHYFRLDVPARRLLNKRFLAHLNVLRSRRHHFDHALMPGLVAKVAELAPDLLLFAGDVSTSSLEGEFEDFRRAAAPLIDAGPGGAGIPGVLVPGNHDRYTFKSRRVRRIDTLLAELVPAGFPHVRTLRPGWTLLALDSAVPNRLFSRGGLDAAQLARAAEVIRGVPAGEALLVLCHYPCALPAGVTQKWSRRLAGAAALERELAACRGRVVYVHGHIHRPWHALPAAGGPSFECLNAGAPCMMDGKYPLGQGFWTFALPDDPLAPLAPVHHHPVSPGPTTGPEGAVPAGETRWAAGPSL